MVAFNFRVAITSVSINICNHSHHL